MPELDLGQVFGAAILTFEFASRGLFRALLQDKRHLAPPLGFIFEDT